MKVQLYNDTVEIDFKDSSHRYKADGKAMPGVSSVLNVLAKDLTDWAAYMAVGAFREGIEPFALTDQKMTKIALKQLSDEARKAHRQKSQKGMDVGSIAHAWIQEEIIVGHAVKTPQYSKTLTDVIEDDIDRDAQIKVIIENTITAQHCVEQWRQWVIDYDIQFIKTETIVHSKKLGYCGTFDCLFRSRKTGKVYMGDYKTSEPQKIKNSKFQVVGHKPYPEHFVQISGYDYAHNEETGFSPDAYMTIYLPKEGNYQVFSREKVETDREDWEHLFRVYEWLKLIRKDK